jgi:hypothetical protein
MTAGPSNNPARWIEEFFDLATQYYIAGRLAVCSGLSTVYGNLLHHAVKMYLKGGLFGALPVHKLRNEYRHDLTKLWAEYKAWQHDPALARFDATVTALHQLESIRYPDRGMGTSFAIEWQRGELGELSPSLQTSVSVTPTYSVPINEIDDLATEIVTRANVNPKAVAVHFSDGFSRDALTYRNPYAEQWDPGESQGYRWHLREDC